MSLLIFLMIFFLVVIPLFRKMMRDVKRIEEKERVVVRKRELPPQPPRAQTKTHVTQLIVNPEKDFSSKLEKEKELSAISERQLRKSIDPYLKSSVEASIFTPLRKKRMASWRRPELGRNELRKMVIYKEIFSSPKSVNKDF